MRHVTRILVPTDFTASSQAALGMATELGVSLGAPLILVHAYGLPAYPLPEGVLMASSSGRERWAPRPSASWSRAMLTT